MFPCVLCAQLHSGRHATAKVERDGKLILDALAKDSKFPARGARLERFATVQQNAQRAWDEGIQFRELLAEAASELDLDAIFDPTAFTRHAADIVGRLDALDG